MGGKEGSRGYLYQTFASIFEELCQNDWDKIYIEYKSANDKVDIALENNGVIIKSTQVKSTYNSFSRSSIITWSHELIKDDVKALNYEIFFLYMGSTLFFWFWPRE